MTTLGAVFRPHSPPEQLPGVARAAEDAGLEELWLWEDCFFQGGVSGAAAALAVTERLRVGIGIVPAPLRNVALTAMETATLQRLSGGRFVLGLGHGVQDWMGQVGVRADSPLTLMREQLTALRALLRGERVTTAGRYVRLDGVALDWPPADPPPVLVGAMGPHSWQLSGEVADGTVLTGSTRPDTLRRARELIDEGRAAGGRVEHHHVVVYLTAATGPEATQRVLAEQDSWGERPIAAYADGVTAASVAKAAEELAEAGADTVVLQPCGDDTDPEAFVRFAAEEVRPLID